MNRKRRVLVIIQICLAVSFLFWLVLHPYLQALMTWKSEILLCKSLMEHTKLFEAMPLVKKLAIQQHHQDLQQAHPPNFFKSLHINSSIFAISWLLFSLVICFLFLFRVEGTEKVVWILPILIVFLTAESFSRYQQPKTESFFPSEDYVITHYQVSKPEHFWKKRECLLEAWHRYLITEWAKEEPQNDAVVFKKQLEQGLFAFNLNRIEARLQGKDPELVFAGFSNPFPFLKFVIYLIWNFYFAWAMRRSEAKFTPI